MADSGTLATTAQVLLAIGDGGSATQILEANTNIWILFAESEMENLSKGKDLVANYATITSTYKQWLASVAAARAAMHGINQNQNSWTLATTQSKFNLLNSIWEDGKTKLQDPDVIAAMNL